MRGTLFFAQSVFREGCALLHFCKSHLQSFQSCAHSCAIHPGYTPILSALIFRLSPVFATLTETAGVQVNSSQIGNLFLSSFALLHKSENYLVSFLWFAHSCTKTPGCTLPGSRRYLNTPKFRRIIARMSETKSPLWNFRPPTRLDRKEPYLLLQQTTVFVRDQERSKRFFVECLGFSVALDYDHPEYGRWVMVAPPDGTARISLVAPKPESEDFARIGQGRQMVFLTENVQTKYREWKERGVIFDRPPEAALFGSVLTNFEDPDGNRYSLIEFDQATKIVEDQRRRTEEALEAERRTRQEQEIARQVQARLFPQSMPEAKSLEYAGACSQARHVGGDYYDFLDLGRGRLGLVMGDIAGKGMAAALLMANLQANFRSQCAIAADEPRRFLRSVNQLFYENTGDGDYATFFYAEYDDATRRLRYANCGHLPALLLRGDGALEKLEATATVLGLFTYWDCEIEEKQLAPRDLLLLYTDGVTESFDEAREEFGERRLMEALRKHGALAPQECIDSIVDEVRRHHPGEQQDDITLIAARCR